MFRGLRYGPDGSLQDDTGHLWIRVRDWVEPDEAEGLVRAGTRFAVQRCLAPPVAERAERFRRDVRAHMVTKDQSDAYYESSTVPTVMVGELWRSSNGEDLLLFVEAAPFPRDHPELGNDW